MPLGANPAIWVHQATLSRRGASFLPLRPFFQGKGGNSESSNRAVNSNGKRAAPREQQLQGMESRMLGQEARKPLI